METLLAPGQSLQSEATCQSVSSCETTCNNCKSSKLSFCKSNTLNHLVENLFEQAITQHPLPILQSILPLNQSVIILLDLTALHQFNFILLPTSLPPIPIQSPHLLSPLQPLPLKSPPVLLVQALLLLDYFPHGIANKLYSPLI